MQTFSNTGVDAGTAKRFQVFSTPADSATSDMKPMYGNIQRVMKTAASKPRGSCFNPLAIIQTNTGAAATPITQVSSKAQLKRVATRSISSLVAASPSLARLAASTGTNAWLNAPSANRRRNRFGMRKATLKASVMALAPKVEAISSSRTRPVIRDTKVKSETVDADLKSDTAGV